MAWLVEVEIPAVVAAEIELFNDGEFSLTRVDQSWTDRANRDAITAAAWDSLTEAADAQRAARELVDEINRRLGEDSPLHPEIKVGSYIWEPDTALAGGVRRHVVVRPTGAMLRFAGGTPKLLINGYEQAPSRTRGLRAKELAQRDESFAAAQAAFAAAGEDIRALWLVWERVETYAGRALKARLGVSRAEISAFGETANARGLRHVSRGGQLSHPEVSGAEARDLMRRLLNAWLDRENPH